MRENYITYSPTYVNKFTVFEKLSNMPSSRNWTNETIRQQGVRKFLVCSVYMSFGLSLTQQFLTKF